MKLATEILTLIVGGLAILLLLPGGAHRPARARRPDPAERPTDLAQLERLTVTGRATAADVHLRLRPVLRELAVDRLRRRGTDIERHPARARALLGTALWELVRADRPRPEDRRAAGLTHEELAEMVARLERV